MEQKLKKKLMSKDKIAKIEFNVIQNEIKTKIKMNNFEK